MAKTPCYVGGSKIDAKVKKAVDCAPFSGGGEPFVPDDKTIKGGTAENPAAVQISAAKDNALTIKDDGLYSSGGDMIAAIYDPKNKKADAFQFENMHGETAEFKSQAKLDGTDFQTLISIDAQTGEETGQSAQLTLYSEARSAGSITSAASIIAKVSADGSAYINMDGSDERPIEIQVRDNPGKKGQVLTSGGRGGQAGWTDTADMRAEVYDPQKKQADAFIVDNFSGSELQFGNSDFGKLRIGERQKTNEAVPGGSAGMENSHYDAAAFLYGYSGTQPAYEDPFLRFEVKGKDDVALIRARASKINIELNEDIGEDGSVLMSSGDEGGVRWQTLQFEAIKGRAIQLNDYDSGSYMSASISGGSPGFQLNFTESVVLKDIPYWILSATAKSGDTHESLTLTLAGQVGQDGQVLASGGTQGKLHWTNVAAGWQKLKLNSDGVSANYPTDDPIFTLRINQDDPVNRAKAQIKFASITGWSEVIMASPFKETYIEEMSLDNGVYYTIPAAGTFFMNDKAYDYQVIAADAGNRFYVAERGQ